MITVNGTRWRRNRTPPPSPITTPEGFGDWKRQTGIQAGELRSELVAARTALERASRLADELSTTRGAASPRNARVARREIRRALRLVDKARDEFSLTREYFL